MQSPHMCRRDGNLGFPKGRWPDSWRAEHFLLVVMEVLAPAALCSVSPKGGTVHQAGKIQLLIGKGQAWCLAPITTRSLIRTVVTAEPSQVRYGPVHGVRSTLSVVFTTPQQGTGCGNLKVTKQVNSTKHAADTCPTQSHLTKHLVLTMLSRGGTAREG